MYLPEGRGHPSEIEKKKAFHGVKRVGSQKSKSMAWMEDKCGILLLQVGAGLLV